MMKRWPHPSLGPASRPFQQIQVVVRIQHEGAVHCRLVHLRALVISCASVFHSLRSPLQGQPPVECAFLHRPSRSAAGLCGPDHAMARRTLQTALAAYSPRRAPPLMRQAQRTGGPRTAQATADPLGKPQVRRGRPEAKGVPTSPLPGHRHRQPHSVDRSRAPIPIKTCCCCGARSSSGVYSGFAVLETTSRRPSTHTAQCHSSSSTPPVARPIGDRPHTPTHCTLLTHPTIINTGTSLFAPLNAFSA